MKIRILACALFFVSSVLLASPPMYESHSEYRDNDVFLFCSDGLKKPRAWMPLDPITAQWTAEPTYCPIPHDGGECPLCVHNYGVHFQSWTHNDYDAWQKWMRICPRGDEEGKWEGQGRPENTPHSH